MYTVIVVVMFKFLTTISEFQLFRFRFPFQFSVSAFRFRFPFHPFPLAPWHPVGDALDAVILSSVTVRISRSDLGDLNNSIDSPVEG